MGLLPSERVIMAINEHCGGSEEGEQSVDRVGGRRLFGGGGVLS